MSVSAIGSSFSYVPPDRVAASQPGRNREPASDTTAPETTQDADASTVTSRPDRLSTSTPSALIDAQESSSSGPGTRQASRVYAARNG